MSAWTYTVSVRSLCEFTAKRGSLDRRFTPSATALEGQAGQLAVRWKPCTATCACAAAPMAMRRT